MYAKHFGFLEDPFGATPDPRYLYAGAEHAEALAALHYGLLERRGFLVLTARPGMGKTTLLHHLLERWKDKADTALVIRPPETREQMIWAVLDDLGLDPAPDYARDCRRLRDLAIECRRRGRRLLLVFDEAQAIPLAVLEEIRLLSNLEAPNEKLVDVVLAGQPELDERLAGGDCEQLRQRVAIRARIRELDAAEVRRYVEHRMRIGGHKRGRLFSARALAALTRLSGGVPRNINAICFQALSAAFAGGQHRIDEAQVERAAAAVNGSARELPRPRRYRWAAGAAFTVLVASALTAGLHFERDFRHSGWFERRLGIASLPVAAAAPKVVPLPEGPPSGVETPPGLPQPESTAAVGPLPQEATAGIPPGPMEGAHSGGDASPGLPPRPRGPSPDSGGASVAAPGIPGPAEGSPAGVDASPRLPRERGPSAGSGGTPAAGSPSRVDASSVPLRQKGPSAGSGGAPAVAPGIPAQLDAAPSRVRASPRLPLRQRGPSAGSGGAPAPSPAIPGPVDGSPSGGAASPLLQPLPPDSVAKVRVAPADTMRQIALRRYGRWDPQVWDHIHKANPGLSDPGKVQVGQVLLLPGGVP